MVSNQCSTCGGTGVRNFVGGSNSTTEYCHSCDGTGYIQVTESIQEPTKRKEKESNKKKKIKQTANKETNLKNVKVGWAIAAFVVGYFVSNMSVSDSVYVSVAIGLISSIAMYKWYKILAPIIGFGLLGFGIYSIFG